MSEFNEEEPTRETAATRDYVALIKLDDRVSRLEKAVDELKAIDRKRRGML